MSEDLREEVTSVNAICGEATLTELSSQPALYALVFPAQQNISIRVEFPEKYPDVPPVILGIQSIGREISKDDGKYLVEVARDVLSQVYIPGAPCCFDLIEEVDSKLRQLGLDDESQSEGQQTPQSSEPSERSSVSSTEQDQPLPDPPRWTLSEVVTMKSSVFVARAVAVTSTEQAKQYLIHLLSTDKKVAKASHNIYALRIRGQNGVRYQDCDDDGETAAGGRLLHLMELMDVWDAMVIVTRWYGGTQLGPDRFRIINSTAREALVEGGLAPDASKDAQKRKGKR